MSNGSGTATADVTNVKIACYIYGTVSTALNLTAAVTTLAGGSQGNTDATGTSAAFNQPGGLTMDGTNLYVTEMGNHQIRKVVISTGVVTTLAGTGSAGNTNGTGTSAAFSTPSGLTTDGTNLYVVEQGNHQLRKIVISTGVVTTLAGTGSAGNTDATGTSAAFNKPSGLTTDGKNLYLTDVNNNKIRQIK